MSDTTEERIVNNNLTFRQANERIRSKAEEWDAPFDRFPFLCECPWPDCVQIVRLTIREYAAVRANPTHFFTAPGHEAAEEPVGRVVGSEDGYVVVEKDQTAVEG
ncbi:MAG: hypothetical protein E6G03_04175 [Actinobacteria bacterium]|nr:MAG: hypothetical protein E6G03_04175 [Actinomycetota bacterium]